MPFAAGPRHCIGETLALYEMYMHLYKVARRYRLTYVPDRPLELEAQINLRTRYPLHDEAGTTHMMTKAETLGELIDRQPHASSAPSPISKARTASATLSYARAVRARARHPVPPAEARRAGRGDKLIIYPRQQRAVPRRLLGRHARRHRAGAGGARHQRRTQAQAAAHRAASWASPSSTPTARRWIASAPSPAAAGEQAAVRRACARAPSSSRPVDDISRAGKRADGQRRRHGLHPVLLRLHQRTEGRRAHARQHPRQRARRRRGGAAGTRTTSACRGCR